MKFLFVSILLFFFINSSYAQFESPEEYANCILNGKLINTPTDPKYVRTHFYWEFYSKVIHDYRKKIISSLKANNLDSLLYYTKNDYALFEFKDRINPVGILKIKDRIDTVNILKIEECEFLYYLQKKYSILYTNILNRTPCFRYGVKCERKADRQYINKSFDAEGLIDSLNLYFASFIINRKENIIQEIKQTGLDDYKKDFLILFLEYKIYESNMCNENFETNALNQADTYLKSYPTSEFNNYIKEIVDIKYKRSNWGFGAYCSSGFIIPIKTLSNYFNSFVPITIGGELNYKRLYLNYLQMEWCIKNKIKNDFTFNNITWLKNDNAWLADGQLTFGYYLLKNKKMNLIPHAGLIGFSIWPSSKNDSLYYENARQIGNGNGCYTFGLTFDYKFGYRSCQKAALKGKNIVKEENYGYLRFKIDYINPRPEKTISHEFNGGFISMNIGIGVYVVPTKKIKKKE